MRSEATGHFEGIDQIARTIHGKVCCLSGQAAQNETKVQALGPVPGKIRKGDQIQPTMKNEMSTNPGHGAEHKQRDIRRRALWRPPHLARSGSIPRQRRRVRVCVASKSAYNLSMQLL